MIVTAGEIEADYDQTVKKRLMVISGSINSTDNRILNVLCKLSCLLPLMINI